MFHCITLFSCTGVTGEMRYAGLPLGVCSDASLHYLGFSDFSSQYFFELGNLVIFNDNVLIVYLLIYKINFCNLLIFS